MHTYIYIYIHVFACKILVLFQYSKTTNFQCLQRVHTNTAQILPSNLLKKNQISSEPQPFKNESIQEPAKTLIQATEGWPLLNYLCMANCVRVDSSWLEVEEIGVLPEVPGSARMRWISPTK